MGMQLMPINTTLIKRMTNEQLVNEFNQSRQNIGLELLRMGAILTERKARPYEGDFKQVIEQEFGFGYRRGYLLMKAWNERDTYIEKVQTSALNYGRLDALLSIPSEDRANFIEQEHPEEKTARKAMQAARDYKALKAELEAEKKARADAESKNAELEGRAMETEQRAQTEVADVKHRIRILKSQHEQERNDLNQQAAQAKAELESLKVELLHKQSEVDALKHEQRMQQEPQIVYQDSEDTVREVNTLKYQLDEIKKQLTDSQTYAKRQTERAEWAEKNAKSQTEMVRRAQAEVQALKNGMSLQAYSREHEAYAQYQSTSEEDYETAQRALRWLGHLGEAPQTEPEVKEWIRCLMLGIEDKPYEMAARRDEVETAMKKLQMFYDALTVGGLKRVK